MLVLGVALPAGAHAAAPGAQIAALNAQRVANGIPAAIVEQPEWTEGCRRHMAYIAANGGTLTHEEQPANPGYTADGASTGARSVLTPLPESFGASGNAFETAPLHLMQTLAPALTQMGVWGGCATTSPGYDRKTARPSLFTYPGDRVGGVAQAETAFEMPFVPGDLVGLPQGTTTGPHVLVMSLGTGPGHLVSAAVSGPAGPLEIRTVDNETPRLAGLMPPGAMIIPVAPLAAAATYQASATFQPTAGGAPLQRSWSFSTGSAAAAAPIVAASPRATRLALSRPRPSASAVTFTLSADQALAGRRARVSILRVVRRCDGGACSDTRVGRTLTSTIGRLAGRQTITAPRPAGGRTIRVLVRTQAFARDGIAYAAASAAGRWSAG